MWKIVEGNIIEAEAQALVNTVNTVGVMGKGIALQFKKAFPAMFAAYEEAFKAGELQLGRMHVYDQGSILNPRYIINFPTKRHWKGKSKLVDIEAGLTALVEEIRDRGITSVAIPPLGCGQGGLDWEQVRPLIQRAMERLPGVEVLIYAPKGPPEPAAIVNRTQRPRMNLNRANMLRLLKMYFVLGYQLTLLEIHKILYFLQAAGEPLRLKYSRGIYGPYAENMRHVLERFEGHFLTGCGDGFERPQTPIQLFDHAVAEAIRVSERDSTPEQEGRMRRVFDLIEGFESPYGMELLASVHWVTVHDGVPNDPQAIVRAVHEWSERKRKVMQPEHIQVARDRLNTLGWLDRGPGAAA